MYYLFYMLINSVKTVFSILHICLQRLPRWLSDNPPAKQVLSLGREDSLEKKMATHSIILAR